MSPHPRARLSAFVAAVALIALSACQDSRIRALDEGMSRDSVISILADNVAPKVDTIQNVYKHNRYLVDGKEFDIYFFDGQNRHLWSDPEVEDKELTPVVVVNGKLEGWGWDHMDDVTSKYRIVVRSEDLPTPR
jgi:hypothetical protein